MSKSASEALKGLVSLLSSSREFSYIIFSYSLLTCCFSSFLYFSSKSWPSNLNCPLGNIGFSFNNILIETCNLCRKTWSTFYTVSFVPLVNCPSSYCFFFIILNSFMKLSIIRYSFSILLISLERASKVGSLFWK